MALLKRLGRRIVEATDAAMYDAIIIGAGMSGLAAGIRLAHFDQKVCILERHTTIGGLNSFYRLGGSSTQANLSLRWRLPALPADPGQTQSRLTQRSI